MYIHPYIRTLWCVMFVRKKNQKKLNVLACTRKFTINWKKELTIIIYIRARNVRAWLGTADIALFSLHNMVNKKVALVTVVLVLVRMGGATRPNTEYEGNLRVVDRAMKRLIMKEMIVLQHNHGCISTQCLVRTTRQVPFLCRGWLQRFQMHSLHSLPNKHCHHRQQPRLVHRNRCSRMLYRCNRRHRVHPHRRSQGHN